MKYKNIRKIASVFALFALVLNMSLFVVAPAVSAAETTIEIMGNGAGSDNDVTVDTIHTNTVVQTNVSDVDNDVTVDANTGRNDANRNTGGDVEIDTGDVEANVEIVNSLNSNSADVASCDCDGELDVLIEGNGADSINTVDHTSTSDTIVGQINDTTVDNVVDVVANTGRNDANRNTGGDVEISTGDVDSEIVIVNSAGTNSARVGGDGGGRSLSARIVGNGADSVNDIILDATQIISIIQDNVTDIDNDIDVDADTGRNDANRNTGGDVEIDTGDAIVDVLVDSATGFNVAEAGCGCITDLLAKISGNGADSDSVIAAVLVDTLGVFQDNETDLDNDVDVDPDTGRNDANRNTGSVSGGDPSITTGDAEADVEIVNSGDVNAFGEGFDLDIPGGFDFGLRLVLDFSDLLDLIGL